MRPTPRWGPGDRCRGYGGSHWGAYDVEVIAKDIEPQPQRLQNLSTRVFWAAAAVGLGVVVAIGGLLVWIAATSPDEKTASLWINVVTRSLAVLAGLGGTFALWLAFRKQHAHELATRIDQDQRNRDQRHREDEARANQDRWEREQRQREITELRIQAVEQLGSEKAAVRIGGLHNLERLGQQHPELRQLILNEICAYLRMPYTRPDETVLSAPSLRGRADDSVDYGAPSQPDTTTDARQEREVRLTAQGILQRHLIADDPEYWDHTSLNLNGAVLEELHLSGAKLSNVDLRSAVLIGNVFFDSATFEGTAGFDSATFEGFVIFRAVAFKSEVFFSSATFESDVTFRSTTFKGRIAFRWTIFKGWAEFSSATFENWADFAAAAFEGSGAFDSVAFRGPATFDSVTFDGVRFDSVAFASTVTFHSAAFKDQALFDSVTFHRLVLFDSVTFDCEPVFQDVLAVVDAEPVNHSWPEGWELEPIAKPVGYGKLRRVDTGPR